MALVKTRVPQINGCAYCLHMHTREARQLGETDTRLYLLNAWHESGLYSDRERAALGWAESLTNIAVSRAPGRCLCRNATTVLGKGTGGSVDRHRHDQCVEQTGDRLADSSSRRACQGGLSRRGSCPKPAAAQGCSRLGWRGSPRACHIPFASPGP